MLRGYKKKGQLKKKRAKRRKIDRWHRRNGWENMTAHEFNFGRTRKPKTQIQFTPQFNATDSSTYFIQLFYWLIRTLCRSIGLGIGSNMAFDVHLFHISECKRAWNLIYWEPILNSMIRTMFNRRFRYGLPIIKWTTSISFDDIDIGYLSIIYSICTLAHPTHSAHSRQHTFEISKKPKLDCSPFYCRLSSV